MLSQLAHAQSAATCQATDKVIREATQDQRNQLLMEKMYHSGLRTAKVWAPHNAHLELRHFFLLTELSPFARTPVSSNDPVFQEAPAA